MTETLVYAKALELAEAVVAERGADFRYCQSGSETACAYVPLADPRFPWKVTEAAIGAKVTGCMVGEILKRADLLTDEVASSVSGIAGLVAGGAVPATAQATRFLNAVQRAQDYGREWGEAVAEGKSEVQGWNWNKDESLSPVFI